MWECADCSLEEIIFNMKRMLVGQAPRFVKRIGILEEIMEEESIEEQLTTTEEGVDDTVE